MKREWVTGLVRLMHDTNGTEAAKAVKELAKVSGFGAEKLLIRALTSAPTPSAREAAAEALKKYDTDEVLDALVRCSLSDEKVAVALWAVDSLFALQRAPTPRKRFAVLMVRLKSRYPQVRLGVVKRLLFAAGKDAPKIAAWALADDDGSVRKLAKYWLMGTDRDDVVPALLRVRKILRGNLRVQHLTAEIIRARWPEIAKDL